MTDAPDALRTLAGTKAPLRCELHQLRATEEGQP